MNRTSHFAMCTAATFLVGCGTMEEDGAEDVQTVASALTQSQRINLIDAKAATISGLLGPPIAAHANLGNGAKRIYTNNARVYVGDAVNRAHEVHGFILGKYRNKSENAGVLGYPTSDEGSTFFGDGRFNFFQSGKIVWRNGATEAFETHGCINTTYNRLGSEWGRLGWPTSDEHIVVGTRKQSNFESGRIYYRGGSCNDDLSISVVFTSVGSGSKLVTNNHRRITSASLQQNGPDAWLVVSGAGFTPNEIVIFRMTNPDASLGTSHTAIVLANGTFSIPSGIIEVTAPAIKKVNGLASLMAVEQTTGARAAFPIPTPLGSNFTGTL